MYYALAMNHKLYAENKSEAHNWADKVVQTSKRDSALTYDYNNVMSGGKWKNMMSQKHIGYTSWNDNFRADTLPQVGRIKEPEKAIGSYVFTPNQRYVLVFQNSGHRCKVEFNSSSETEVNFNSDLN